MSWKLAQPFYLSDLEEKDEQKTSEVDTQELQDFCIIVMLHSETSLKITAFFTQHEGSDATSCQEAKDNG